MRCGHLLKYRPPSKEKMEPQSWSIHTGTTGAPPRRAINSKPFLSRSNVPVRVSSPSGNMQTTSPAWRDSDAARRASFAWPGEMGMVPKRRKIGFSSG